MYEQVHIPGAINLPLGKLVATRLSEWPDNTLFVVYCAGPHCNGANKAAVRLTRLGRSVKELVGGLTSWAAEGFAFAHGHLLQEELGLPPIDRFACQHERSFISGKSLREGSEPRGCARVD
jgi:3-mercaptopyruvate sulfurtransferase SseA